MKYRNKRTGAVIDVNSTLGGDWEQVKAPAVRKTTEKKTEPARRKGMTKK